MGKSKKKPRPTKISGLTKDRPVKTFADPETEILHKQKILPVLKDLTSPEPNSRSLAASAIANLIEDAKCRKLLLKERLVRVLMEQTITDANLEVAVRGWGVFRNLALEEGSDFGLHLYRLDILTSLEAALKSIIASFDDGSFLRMPKKQQDCTWDLAESLLSILTSLSETEQDIVVAISNLPGVPAFQMYLLGASACPENVKETAMTSLHALTEDNDALAKKFGQRRDWITTLLKIPIENAYLHVAACGVLHNIAQDLRFSDEDDMKDELLDRHIVAALAHVLQRSIMEKADSDMNGVSNLAGIATSISPQTLQLALEIIASVVASVQEDLEAMTVKDDLHGEFFTDKMDIEQEVAETGKDGNRTTETSSNAVLMGHLLKTTTPLLLKLAIFSQNASEQWSTVHTRALSTLSNIAWTMCTIVSPQYALPAGEEEAYNSWPSLAQQIWTQTIAPVLSSNTADVSLANSISTLAWALARSVSGRIQLSCDEHLKFMALYQAVSTLFPLPSSSSHEGEEEEQHNPSDLGLKCIGVLGALALAPNRIAINSSIGTFLLSLLTALPSTPAAHALEALDQLFDIYADASYDYDQPVFWGRGDATTAVVTLTTTNPSSPPSFLLVLEDPALTTKLKTLAKSIDKRKHPALRSRADDALRELPRFCRYKRLESREARA